MAQIHRGKNSLMGKAYRNLAAGIACIIIVVVCFYLLFVERMQVKSWYYLLPCMAALLASGYYVRRGVIFRFGARGETVGLAHALNLPDDYHVFTNLKVCYQNYCQEADLIIVGIKGVYVVEVKNHNGRIVGDGDAAVWTQHKVGRGGGKYSKEMPNPIKQVRGQVYKLSKLFKENGINVWVDGIVLFTNESVNVHVASNHTGTPVLHPTKRLNQHILTHNNRQYLNKNLIGKVVEILNQVKED